MKLQHHPIKFVLWGTGSALGRRRLWHRVNDRILWRGGRLTMARLDRAAQVIRPEQIAAENTRPQATNRFGRRGPGE